MSSIELDELIVPGVGGPLIIWPESELKAESPEHGTDGTLRYLEINFFKICFSNSVNFRLLTLQFHY